MTTFTKTPEETEALGQKLGDKVRGGDVLALFGGLGSGKTTFVRGLARGLGIGMPVTSPTYTIVNEYPGKIPLFHFDMYRLADSDELFEIGWEDYMQRGGVIAVEWSENVEDAFERGTIRVYFERTDEGRTIKIEFPDERDLMLETELTDEKDFSSENEFPNQRRSLQ